MMLQIIDYDDRYREDFRRLNEAWLERHFTIEPIDAAVLTDPQAHILTPGGAIFFARLDEEIVGTCALIPVGDDLELSKMAVAEAHQGLGIGRQLLDRAISFFHAGRAGRLFLETSSRLQPAIRLFERAGFVRQPGRRLDSHYQRADVYMVFAPPVPDTAHRLNHQQWSHQQRQTPSRLGGQSLMSGEEDMQILSLLTAVALGQSQFEPVTLSRNVAFPFALGVVDANADDAPDLVVAAQSGNRLILYLNRGEGMLEGSVLDGAIFAPGFIAVGDLDGDRRQDLVVAVGGDGRLALYAGRGDGSFAAPRVLDIDFEGGTTPAIADVDGDGDQDILVASIQQGSVGWLEQTGPGSFIPHEIDANLSGPIGLAACDFNADGRSDVAVADLSGINGADSLFAFLNGADGFSRLAIAVQNAGSIAVECGDIDGDADPDIVALSQFGDVEVYRNEGLASGDFTRVAGTRPVMSAGSVALADLDGDGRNDIVATAFQQERVAVWLNGEDALADFAFEAFSAPAGTDVAVADFTGDRVADIATIGSLTTSSVDLLVNTAPAREGAPVLSEGTWVAPGLPGQGITLDHLAGNDQLFLAWFTFVAADAGKLGAPDQRWLTGQLDINATGTAASGPLFSTSGGRFGEPPAAEQRTEQVGGATVTLDACDRITLSYDVPAEVSGSLELVPLESLTSGDFSCP